MVVYISSAQPAQLLLSRTILVYIQSDQPPLSLVQDYVDQPAHPSESMTMLVYIYVISDQPAHPPEPRTGPCSFITLLTSLHNIIVKDHVGVYHF